VKLSPEGTLLTNGSCSFLPPPLNWEGASLQGGMRKLGTASSCGPHRHLTATCALPLLFPLPTMLLYPLTYSLYDACAYTCDLFARAVWEREKKVAENKEKVGGDWWQLLAHCPNVCGKTSCLSHHQLSPAARQLTARIQIQESKLER